MPSDPVKIELPPSRRAANASRLLRAVGGPGSDRCGACRRRVGRQESVRILGAPYHRDCAFYRSRADRSE